MKIKTLRKQRAHGVFPAGFEWRDGRPRWNPSPIRRKAGWRIAELRDARGDFLTKGAAIDAAQALADACQTWRNGGEVPPELACYAPKGAVAHARPGDPKAIGVLLDAYYESPAFLKDLGENTQKSYRSKIKRVLYAVADISDSDGRKAEADKLGALRQLSIDLFKRPTKPGVPFVLDDTYQQLRDMAGEAMAFGSLAATSAWLSWCIDKHFIWEANPCEHVKRAKQEGRIVTLDFHSEIVPLCREAEKRGEYSIADAILLAVDLSWLPSDLLTMTWGQLSADFRIKHKRVKTGVAGNPPLLDLGRARIQAMIARRGGRGAAHEPIITCERSGKAWSLHDFRVNFAAIRKAVAKTAPTVEGKRFADLRDTAVTIAYMARLTPQEIAARTLHNLPRVTEILSAHYGNSGWQVEDNGAQLLNAHFKAEGYTYDSPPRLVAAG